MIREEGLDFDDALLALTVRKLSKKSVISPEPPLESVDGVNKVTPESLE